MSISGKRVAILVEQDFEDSELAEPLAKMKAEGASVTIVGSEAGKSYKGKKGREEATADKAADQVKAADFDAIIVPGGSAPEKMRLNPAMVRLVQDAAKENKVIASICHGAQLLITAGLLKGRTATCWIGIRDDVKNAGASYRDEPVVVDGMLITSRMPDDIPQFNAAILKALSE